MTSKVYIGVPVGNTTLRKRRRQTLKLLRILSLGLLVIDPDIERHGVDAVLDPGEYRPRPSRRRRGLLLKEFLRRDGDPNLGGTSLRRGIMTAHRQRALGIAVFLQTNGPTRASLVATAIGDPKARDIMYRDVYGWFERPVAGVYALSARGMREISHCGRLGTRGNDGPAVGGRGFSRNVFFVIGARRPVAALR
ncbi:MAG: DUF2161 family putative PD-(D/E)XK-type phosphodiesterase [Chloroflexi bacterium]|nr:DUF2161 family putative PD-(D/E)XK-type phosphodiesterase [Chloroflexota bacterium]